MTDRPQPYVRRDPGDVIRSGDWNELQIKTREEVHTHRHSGADGLKIPRDGIEANAINGELIDPTAKVELDSLTINKELKVNGKAILNEVDDLLTKLKVLEDEKMNRAGDTINGSLAIDKDLTVHGSINATPIMGSWYPTAHGPNASTPGGQQINIVFDGENSVTDQACFSSLDGGKEIRIEKEGYYHLEAVALVYVKPGDYGHLYLYIDGNYVDIDHSHSPSGVTWDDRHSSWKGYVKAGSVVSASVHHHLVTNYWYHQGSHYTRLTIHKIS